MVPAVVSLQEASRLDRVRLCPTAGLEPAAPSSRMITAASLAGPAFNKPSKLGVSLTFSLSGSLLGIGSQIKEQATDQADLMCHKWLTCVHGGHEVILSLRYSATMQGREADAVWSAE